MSGLADRLRAQAVRHHKLAGAAAGVARAARLEAMARKLDHAAVEGTGGQRPSTILLPRRLPADGRSFRMLSAGGADLVVRKLTLLGWDGFERPMPDVFVGLVNRLGGTVIDVGANTGFYSVLACVASSRARALAFEPFPPLLPLLEGNVKLNYCEGRVSLSRLALSDTEGRSTLYVPLQDHGLVESSCSLNAGFKEESSATVEVEVTTLDSFMAHSAVPDVQVVKVDVESLEHAVLAGAEGTLSRHRPFVFVEVLHIGDPDAIDRLRRRLHYVDARLRVDHAVIGDDVRHDPDAWNHLLVPAERMDEATVALRSVGLELIAAEPS